MRRFIGIVLAQLVVCVPGLRAEKPGTAGQAPEAKAPDWKPLLRERRSRFGQRPGQEFKPYVQYDRMPHIHVTPNGVFVGTDEEFRKREEKWQAERKQLEAGAKRISHIEQQFAERQREKGKSALIGLGIVAAVFFVRVLASGSKPAR